MYDLGCQLGKRFHWDHDSPVYRQGHCVIWSEIMKKLMAVLAICAVAGYVAAQTVVSGNIVGYSSSYVTNQLSMFGMNFQGLGTNGPSLTLSGLNPDPNIGFADLDTIETGLADENGVVQFTSYFYMGADIAPADAGWYESDYSTYAGNQAIPLGSSIWVQLASAQNVLVAGQVSASSVTQNFVANALTMSSSAFPVAFNPNDSSCTWSGVQDLDQIQVGVPDQNGVVQFTTYFYMGLDIAPGAAGWYESDYSTYVSSPIVPVNGGFWVLTQGTASLVQTSPIK